MVDPVQIVKFEYQQSLAFAAGRGEAWSEQFSISVRILSEAFTSGWYRAVFGKDAKSFIVLMAIVMHARPLQGSDLELLISLGMARQFEAAARAENATGAEWVTAAILECLGQAHNRYVLSYAGKILDGWLASSAKTQQVSIRLRTGQRYRFLMDGNPVSRHEGRASAICDSAGQRRWLAHKFERSGMSLVRPS